LNRYNLINEGAINTSTVVAIDPKLMKIVYLWGKDFFYLPHGLSFDHEGNIWLTDVAMHQIFKISATGSKVPLLTLGQKFEPGSDENHFCKPTSVALDPNLGDFYVADGYCNSRVMRFNSEGKFLNQWGQKDYPSDVPAPVSFSIPHKITFINEKIICVADREHGRILCFKTPHGEFQFMIKHHEFGERVFSISHTSNCGDVLYAVNGPSLNLNQKVKGFVLNLTNHQIVDTFFPPTGVY
jgi:peptidyl-glycine alpha-amidating monooxygenase A